MERITVKDVDRVFIDRYCLALSSLGVNIEGLKLERGVGHWTLTDKDGFAAPGVVGHGLSVGYIGHTAREADATLQTIAKTLEVAGSFMVSNPAKVMR